MSKFVYVGIFKCVFFVLVCICPIFYIGVFVSVCSFVVVCVLCVCVQFCGYVCVCV